MSALALAHGTEGGAAARAAQPRLFALPGGAVEAPAAGPEGAGATVTAQRRSAPAPVRTLDDVLSKTWAAVGAGRAAPCPLCAGPLRPRWSAGAGAVGGRCGDCGTVVE